MIEVIDPIFICLRLETELKKLYPETERFTQICTPDTLLTQYYRMGNWASVKVDWNPGIGNIIECVARIKVWKATNKDYKKILRISCSFEDRQDKPNKTEKEYNQEFAVAIANTIRNGFMEAYS
jgi:hypothetical protein